MTMFFGPRGEITKRLLDILHEVQQYDEDFLKLENYEKYILNARIKDKITILHEEERDIKKIKALGRSIRILLIELRQYWDLFEKRLGNLKGADLEFANKLYLKSVRFSGTVSGKQTMKAIHEYLVGPTLKKFQENKWEKMTDSDCESEIKHLVTTINELLKETKEFYHFSLQEYRQRQNISLKVFMIVYEFFSPERKHELGKLAQEHP